MTKGTKRTSSNGKDADLERVRNNQRRCRARQKEYIASLECKIRQYESDGAESETNKKLEQLATENRLLKRLLHSLGLHDDFIEAYHRATQIAPNLSRPPLQPHNQPLPNIVASPSVSLDADALQPYATETGNAPENPQGIDESLRISGIPCCRDMIQEDAFLTWDLLNIPTTPTSATNSLAAVVPSETVEQSHMDTDMVKTSSDKFSFENISETTSLCSWAFSLVLRNNAKGYSAADLDLKLRTGYRFDDLPAEGCRIDNDILLRVLAEVS